MQQDLQDRNVVVNLGPVLLGDALGDPDDVAALLLLEAQVGVEDPAVELLHEGIHVQLHFVLEKLVLQSLFPGVVASAFKQSSVLLE